MSKTANLGLYICTDDELVSDNITVADWRKQINGNGSGTTDNPYSAFQLIDAELESLPTLSSNNTWTGSNNFTGGLTVNDNQIDYIPVFETLTTVDEVNELIDKATDGSYQVKDLELWGEFDLNDTNYNYARIGQDDTCDVAYYLTSNGLTESIPSCTNVGHVCFARYLKAI